MVPGISSVAEKCSIVSSGMRYLCFWAYRNLHQTDLRFGQPALLALDLASLLQSGTNYLSPKTKTVQPQYICFAWWLREHESR